METKITIERFTLIPREKLQLNAEGDGTRAFCDAWINGVKICGLKVRTYRQAMRLEMPQIKGKENGNGGHFWNAVADVNPEIRPDVEQFIFERYHREMQGQPAAQPAGRVI